MSMPLRFLRISKRLIGGEVVDNALLDNVGGRAYVAVAEILLHDCHVLRQKDRCAVGKQVVETDQPRSVFFKHHWKAHSEWLTLSRLPI